MLKHMKVVAHGTALYRCMELLLNVYMYTHISMFFLFVLGMLCGIASLGMQVGSGSRGIVEVSLSTSDVKY